MSVETQTNAISEFPLRLVPSVRQRAEEFSKREGVSLNHFINDALAEKLAHMQHVEWDQKRGKATPEDISRALRLLDLVDSQPTEVGDELPDGYVSMHPNETAVVSVG